MHGLDTCVDSAKSSKVFAKVKPHLIGCGAARPPPHHPDEQRGPLGTLPGHVPSSPGSRASKPVPVEPVCVADPQTAFSLSACRIAVPECCSSGAGTRNRRTTTARLHSRWGARRASIPCVCAVAGGHAGFRVDPCVGREAGPSHRGRRLRSEAVCSWRRPFFVPELLTHFSQLFPAATRLCGVLEKAALEKPP